MAVMTTAQIDKLNRMNPTTQELALGTQISGIETIETGLTTYSPVIINKDITADASTAVVAFTAPFAMVIVDVIVQARALSTNGALQPIDAGAAGTGSDAMCAAIACAADGAVTHMSAGADDTHLALSAGDVVKIIATGDTAANVLGLVTFIGYRA